MKYPLRGDYEIAVKYLDKFVLDPVLKKGKAVTQVQNPHFLFSLSGGKAIVYQIQTNSKKYALKCWVEDLGDLKNRYQAIDNYLTTVKLPYFVDFAYDEKGIIVSGQKYPIVRMEWVEGVSFKEFITNNIKNPVYIRDFADKFLEMMTILHEKDISHGDLQHGNIKVRSNGDICLIDYDSLYVPQLSNEKDVIKGLPGYQHPHRKNLDKLSPKSDYFSELIIYLSLLVIAENPHYWQKIEQEERLIFSEKDLLNPSSSSTFKELKKLSPEIVYFTEQLEKCCQTSNIEYLQPLEMLVNGYKGKKKTFVFPINTNPNLTPPPPPTIKIDTNSPAFAIFETDTSKPPITNPTPQVSDPWIKIDNNLKAKKDDSWSKLGEKPSNPFDDKFSQKTPVSIPEKDLFDKIKPSEPDQPQPVVTDKNLWDKFENIWKKLSNSVSSIWNRIINWFN